MSKILYVDLKLVFLFTLKVIFFLHNISPVSIPPSISCMETPFGVLFKKDQKFGYAPRL